MLKFTLVFLLVLSCSALAVNTDHVKQHSKKVVQSDEEFSNKIRKLEAEFKSYRAMVKKYGKLEADEIICSKKNKFFCYRDRVCYDKPC